MVCGVVWLSKAISFFVGGGGVAILSGGIPLELAMWEDLRRVPTTQQLLRSVGPAVKVGKDKAGWFRDAEMPRKRRA